MRTYDAQQVAEAVAYIRQTEEGFDPIDWVADHRNVALSDAQGNIAILENDSPGIVIGHYYFKSRGKFAVSAALDFLDEIFNSCYNIEVIKGFTALTHLGARWLNRRIGLKSYGVIRAHGRVGELFILTKKEYQNK